MKRAVTFVAALLGCVLLAGGAYAVADAHDKVPGVLTLPAPVPSGLVPLPTASPAPSASEAPAPTAAGVSAALTPLLADKSLGPGAGAVVRDVASEEVLLSADAERPRTIASVQKVLSSLAVTEHLKADRQMVTSVVAGMSPADLVLVAGGDTLLATGKGDPTATVGRAGLADLAEQVAAAAPPGPLTVRLDTSYAAGPPLPSAWNPQDLLFGFTRRVAMIGLAENRPSRGIVPRAETDDMVRDAFVTALRATGREVAPAPPGPAPAAGTPALGAVRSAPVADVLAHGMADSDNAILENLVRQAVVESGQPVPADGNIGPFITAELVKAGIDTTGAVITDAAGLAPGQLVSVKTVDQVLALGLGKDHPDLRRVLTQLPISGLSGTMASRFGAPDTVGVAGIPRAKTGTLTGISALAGITTDADGRALSFVVVADQVPASSEGTLGARATLDRFVAALTRCGCR